MAITTGVAGKLCTLGITTLGVEALLAQSDVFTFTGNQGTIDLTNRDSDWWAEHISGIRDWEISGEGLYIYNDLCFRKLLYHYTARTPTTLACKLILSDGTYYLSGTCTLTNLTLPAPHADKATASFSLKGTGALTPTPTS